MAQRDEHPLPADHTLLTTLPGWSPTNPPSSSSSSSSSSFSSSSSSSSTTRNYNDYQQASNHHRNLNSYSEMDRNQFDGGSTSGSHLDSSGGSASNARASATASLLERQEYLDRMKKLRNTVLAT